MRSATDGADQLREGAGPAWWLAVVADHRQQGALVAAALDACGGGDERGCPDDDGGAAMSVPKVPVNFLGMPFGLAGLGEVWTTLAGDNHAPALVGDLL